VSWTLNYLTQNEEAEDLLAHFDAAILRYIDVQHWDERNDLMSGLAGVGVYAAARRCGYAFQIADLILSHLENTALVSDAGTTWRTAPQFLAESRRAQFPDGVVDLGVAHGVPGIVGMLARFVEANIEASRSRQLLQSTIEWLLRTTPDTHPRFGTNWPGDHTEHKRIGWCYGDAGIAGVLLHASRVTQSAELESLALDLLRRIIIPIETRGVPDASFCHGAAGLAHIYNVAFQYTGDLQMRAQAERWIVEVLRLRKPGFGIAGYASLKIGDGVMHWSADITLLSGAVGVALVLLAAIEEHEPAWQTLFLL
jgi:lantibiotic modifying enzyme